MCFLAAQLTIGVLSFVDFPAMVEKHPFLEDGSQFGVSRTQFRRMRKADKRELMVQWFHQNYEDPSNETPRDSGEFVYIWGGPYEARDELYAKFGDIAPEELIEEVVREVEKGGLYDWAPVQKGAEYEPTENDDEPAFLDGYLNEPGPQYGSAEELEARKQAVIALERLEKIIEKRRAIGMGHNHPPEGIEAPDLPEIREAVAELKAEFQKPNPAIAAIKKWAKPLRDALVAAGKWSGKKIDKAVDEAMKPIGIGAGTYAVTQLFPPIHHAFDAVIHWLELAAKSIL